MKVRLHTSLDGDECFRRLANAVGDERLDSLGEVLPSRRNTPAVVGTFDEEVIRLRRRRGYWYRNEFAPVLHCRFAPAPGGDGTRIEGRFALSPPAKVIVSAWPAIAIWVACHGAPWGVVALIAGVGLANFGLARLFAVDDPAFLTDFLSRTLTARVVTGEE